MNIHVLHSCYIYGNAITANFLYLAKTFYQMNTCQQKNLSEIKSLAHSCFLKKCAAVQSILKVRVFFFELENMYANFSW